MTSSNLESNDKIDLTEIFQTLWNGRKLIILVTAIIAISSVIYALQVTKYYQSETIMLVRNNSQNQGVLSQLTGAASLLGVNLSASSDDKSLQAIQLIQSRNFVKNLLKYDDVLPSMMAAKSYNSSSKEIIYDPSLYDSENNRWLGEPNHNGEIGPSYLDAYEIYMGDMMTISQDRSGFIQIYIKHISPIFAKEFLELIIKEANALLRNKDLEESSQAIEYLKSELSKTSFVEIRESINTLIEAQLEIQMMANLNEDYILVEIEPPFIPEKNMKTNRLLIVVFSTMFGGLLGVLFVLIRQFLIEKGIKIEFLNI